MMARYWPVAIAASLLLFAADAGRADTHIGVAAAVKNDVQGLQGGTSSALAAGTAVFQDEVVKTGDASVAQLLFLDETSVSLGPKAQIKLDRFVFDPTRHTGDVVLSVSRGAFRFITGSQASRNYQIKTPVATIGVRGTILDCYVSPTSLACILQEGGADLRLSDRTIDLDRAGQMVAVRSDGGVSGPFPSNGTLGGASGLAFPLPSNTATIIDTIEKNGGAEGRDNLEHHGCSGAGCPPKGRL